MKVARNLKRNLMGSFALLYGAGAAYWASRAFLRHPGEFGGEEPHWLERLAGPVHLTAAFLLVFVVGMFWSSHVGPALKARRHRVTGWAYLSLMAGLALSGVAVVYGGEALNRLAGQVHPWIGASLLPLLVAHWRGKKRAARKPAKRRSPAKVVSLSVVRSDKGQ